MQTEGIEKRGEDPQVVTMSIFHFTGLRRRWRAFQLMGLSPGMLKGVDGLQFGKMLGSGGGNGFSIWPNFGIYALLCVWRDEQSAAQFLAHGELFGECAKASENFQTIFMHTTMVHGSWDGQAPFIANAVATEDDPVCVLTRATISRRHLWRFWRYVPPVSRSVAGREGLLMAMGIGELPLIQQATFSWWASSKEMQAYAYQSEYHSKVVRKTRELGWYSEELFARFTPFRIMTNDQLRITNTNNFNN